ncbi:hypothetical protein D3C72_930860 [compost metagenome]
MVVGSPSESFVSSSRQALRIAAWGTDGWGFGALRMSQSQALPEPAVRDAIQSKSAKTAWMRRM